MQQSFRELGVSSPVVDALSARSIDAPFRIQALVLPDALGGLDILAAPRRARARPSPSPFRSWSGRQPPTAVPRARPRPHARARGQVTDELSSLAKPKASRVESAYGGVPLSGQAKRVKGAHILVATPGRLEDLAERRLVDLRGIKILVLDEADRMLDFGFKPQVDRIVRRLPQNRQTMFFSATLDGEVGRLARVYTRSPVYCEAELATGQQPAEIEHRFVPVTVDTKVATLAQHILGADGLTLVFVRTKRGADRLVHKLRSHHVEAVAMHGNMSQNARERALRPLRLRQGERARRHRRRRRGPRPRGRHARDQLRPARGGQGLRPPHGPHRPSRPKRHRDHLVLPEEQGEDGRAARRLGHHEEFAEAGMRAAPAKLVYTSRRGRRSKW
jgi:hypothetical protein